MAKKGDTMVCDACGLAVTVCDECGCETDQLICCGEPMRARKPRRTASRTSKRTKTKTRK
jgi:hypothetical protein